MRTQTALLAMLVCLAGPLSAEAGKGRSMSRGFSQPQAYRKNQTIIPEKSAVVQARQQHLEKLQADLGAIAPHSTPTQNQKTALYQDLLTVVDGSSKPAPALVQHLSNDLADTMSRLNKGASVDTRKLAQSLKVVMNCAYLSPVNVHTATVASVDLLKSSGISVASTQSIADDLKAISTQAAAQGRPGMIR